MLDLALKVADSSTCKQKHGCVITRGGRVLAVGVNKPRNDPAFVTHSDSGRSTIYSVHAEIDAASRVDNLAGCVVYIARSNNRMSRPCDNCYTELLNRGVKSIVFTH